MKPESEPAPEPEPKPLPPEMRAAWHEAGAQAGWMGDFVEVFTTGNTLFLPGDKPRGKVPAFRPYAASHWPAGHLDSLPAPEQAFGLQMNDRLMGVASLQDLARFKKLRWLNLGDTFVTDEKLKDLSRSAEVFSHY